MSEKSAFASAFDSKLGEAVQSRALILDLQGPPLNHHKSDNSSDAVPHKSLNLFDASANTKLTGFLKKWNEDPEMMDPGFSGGAAAIRQRRQQEGDFLRAILHGGSYSGARQIAGMAQDMDPGFGGGQEQLRAKAMQEARLLQGIANGLPYQAARQAAGMGRDMDPGFGGGERQIEENLRKRASRLGFAKE